MDSKYWHFSFFFKVSAIFSPRYRLFYIIYNIHCAAPHYQKAVYGNLENHFFSESYGFNGFTVTTLLRHTYLVGSMPGIACFDLVKWIWHSEKFAGYNQSHYTIYISHNFCGTEIEIWAGFGSVGSTEKKNLADFEQRFRAFFSF